MIEGEEVNLNHELFSVWKGDHRRQDYDLVKMEMEIQTVEIPTIEVEGYYAVDQHDLPKIEIPKKLIDIEAQRVYWIKESLKTYTLLKKCVYLDRKKKLANDEEILACHCIKCDPEMQYSYEQSDEKISYNCGDKCVTRMVCCECDVTTCPSGENCRNRRFQLHQNARVYPYPYQGKGWGLRAGENIKKGQFIMQFLGEIYSLDSEEGQIRNEAYNKSGCTYVMNLSGNDVLDQTFRGNMARFVNHSCKPNCITQKWHVLGEVCIGIFALVDIKENEELTIDYTFDVLKTPWKKCLCGAMECRGNLAFATRNTNHSGLDDEMFEEIACNVCGRDTDAAEEKLVICACCHERIHASCLSQTVTHPSHWICVKCRDVKVENGESNFVNQKHEEDLGVVEAPWETNLRLYKLAKKKHGKGSDFSVFAKTNKLIAMEEEESKRDNPYYRRYEKQYYYFKKLEVHAKKEVNEPIDDDEDYAPLFDNRSKSSGKNGMEKGKESGKTKQKSSKDAPKGKQSKSQKDKGGTSKDSRIKKALDIFQRELAEHPWLSYQTFEMETEQNNELLRHALLVNKLQLEVLKHNQQALSNVGVSIFWETVPEVAKGDLEIYRRNIELTIVGTSDQMECFGDLMKVVMKAAGAVQRGAGCFEAEIPLPAIYLRKLIGQDQSGQIELERKYIVIIEYDEEYYNDNCYSISIPTHLRVKGTKKNIDMCHKAIVSLTSNLTTLSIFFSPNEIKCINRNLTALQKSIHPVEIRISREPVLDELFHPCFYVKYKEREVTLIGTAKEIQRAEEVLRSFLKKESDSLRLPVFVDGHFLWPVMSKENLQRLKSELVAEDRGAKFFFYEPSYDRSEMTVNITAKKELYSEAKALLKAKFKKYHQDGQSFEDFQESAKGEVITTTIESLYLSLLMKKSLGFWDLFSTELEFLNRVAHRPTKQFLEKLVQKDVSLQLYLISLLNMDQRAARQVFSLSTGNIFAAVRNECEQLKTHVAFSQREYKSVLTDPIKARPLPLQNMTPIKQEILQDIKPKSQTPFSNPPRMFSFSDDTDSRAPDTSHTQQTFSSPPPFHTNQPSSHGVTATGNVTGVSTAIYGQNNSIRRYSAVNSLRQIQEPISIVPKMFRYSESIGVIQDTTLETYNPLSSLISSANRPNEPTQSQQPKMFSFSESDDMRISGPGNQKPDEPAGNNQKKDGAFSAPKFFTFGDNNEEEEDDEEEGFIPNPFKSSNEKTLSRNNSNHQPPRMFSFSDNNEQARERRGYPGSGHANNPIQLSRRSSNNHPPLPRMFTFDDRDERRYEPKRDYSGSGYASNPTQLSRGSSNNRPPPPRMFTFDDRDEQKHELKRNYSGDAAGSREFPLNRESSNNAPRMFTFGDSNEQKGELSRNYSNESSQNKGPQLNAPRMFSFDDSPPPNQRNADSSYRRDQSRCQNYDRDFRGYRGRGNNRDYDNRNSRRSEKTDDDYDNVWKSTKDDPAWRNLPFIASKIAESDEDKPNQRSPKRSPRRSPIRSPIRSPKRSPVVESNRIEEEKPTTIEKTNSSSAGFTYNQPRMFTFDSPKNEPEKPKHSTSNRSNHDDYSRKESRESKRMDQELPMITQDKKMESEFSIEIKETPEVKYNPLLQRVNLPPPRVFQFADDAENTNENSSKRDDNEKRSYGDRSRDSRYYKDRDGRSDSRRDRDNRDKGSSNYYDDHYRNRSYERERNRDSPPRQQSKYGSQLVIKRRGSSRDKERNYDRKYERDSPDRYEKASGSYKDRERSRRNRSRSRERSPSYNRDRNRDRDQRRRTRSRSRSRSREKKNTSSPDSRNDKSTRRPYYSPERNQRRSISPDHRSDKPTMKMKLEYNENRRNAAEDDKPNKEGGENKAAGNEYSKYFQPVRIFEMPADSPERDDYHSKSKGKSSYEREGKNTNAFIMSFQKQEPRNEIDDY